MTAPSAADVARRLADAPIVPIACHAIVVLALVAAFILRNVHS